MILYSSKRLKRQVFESGQELEGDVMAGYRKGRPLVVLGQCVIKNGSRHSVVPLKDFILMIR